MVKDEKGVESWTNATEGVFWEVALAPDALATQKFAIDRTAMEAGATYAAVMQIEDLGGTQMRVRIPVTVDEKPADEAAFRATGMYDSVIPADAAGFGPAFRSAVWTPPGTAIGHAMLASDAFARRHVPARSRSAAKAMDATSAKANDSIDFMVVDYLIFSVKLQTGISIPLAAARRMP